VSDLFSNPEFLRNVRAQLRWGRMMVAGAICAAVSLVLGYSFARGMGDFSPPHAWGMSFLDVILTFQVIALLIGGGIACLQSVQREKDLNTFDFQRVTRLTPLELALGKLFGAPVMTYFVVLCLMPAALVGAFVGRARPSSVVAAYAVLLVGSIGFHSLALLVSLLTERNATTGAVLLFLVLVGFTSIGSEGGFGLGKTNAFYATDLVVMTSWQVNPKVGPGNVLGAHTDSFFGWPVHHVPVFLALNLIFIAWFLLATVRNIKRDPSVYELYTPMQALGFALTVNLVLIGFYRWNRLEPMEAQAVLLGLNLVLFFGLGLVLLRNRERLRRLLRQEGEKGRAWLAAIWPAAHLLVGLGIVGLVVIGVVYKGRDPKAAWDLGLAVFRVVFLALWLVRDVLFLQWMNLRRGRRQVVLGVLYLVVFYVCTGILFSALDLYRTPRATAFTAFFTPAVVFSISGGQWAEARNLCLGAAAAQVAISFVFVALQRKKLEELSAPVTIVPVA